MDSAAARRILVDVLDRWELIPSRNLEALGQNVQQIAKLALALRAVEPPLFVVLFVKLCRHAVGVNPQAFHKNKSTPQTRDFLYFVRVVSIRRLCLALRSFAGVSTFVVAGLVLCTAALPRALLRVLLVLLLRAEIAVAVCEVAEGMAHFLLSDIGFKLRLSNHLKPRFQVKSRTLDSVAHLIQVRDGHFLQIQLCAILRSGLLR
ncbi:hypothetical protein B0H17DRAFT_162848 [Mycena rosella]|uniref:Uncharacterized protein n=1 Tax=Mycena rosella TaxID=1033263 RepID=A0AAD7D1H1_MYCRO|nr:hypothetical protein B0H17DRAFT_162848 [Mycena rosella]